MEDIKSKTTGELKKMFLNLERQKMCEEAKPWSEPISQPLISSIFKEQSDIRRELSRRGIELVHEDFGKHWMQPKTTLQSIYNV